MNWLKQQWAISKFYWRWVWMSKAQRAQARAMRKLLFNALGNAPMDKIMAGQSCSWESTPKQLQGAMKGVQEYTKVVTGEDIKIAETKQPRS